jgi:DNA-directed RNA polymerase specialized sigma24 family protein
VRSQLLLSFVLRWPKFDGERASVRTFASRVMDRELTSILRHHLAPSRREQGIPQPTPTVSAAVRDQFRLDLERVLASQPPVIQQTALVLFWCSTAEAAQELRCSRQIIHLRKRRIRRALVEAGIGPRYFQMGGSR